ncbi:unnamed protein product, partial [Pylaiella littoralis]
IPFGNRCSELDPFRWETRWNFLWIRSRRRFYFSQSWMMVFVHDGCRGATVSGVSMLSGQTCPVILGQPCPVEIIRKRGLAVRACPTFNSTLVVGFLAAGCTFKN